MDRGGFLYKDFISHLGVEATSCQDSLLRDIAAFLTGDDADIMVVNGYAGTGKTTAIAAVVNSLVSLNIKCKLMAPTGRAAKVLSQYTGKPACTIHKGIYRQKSVGADGMGRFTLDYNKSKDTLFVVDEVSLIGAEGQDRPEGVVFGSGNLLEDLVNYVRAGADCRLILIGDAAQLPPVGLDCSPALSEAYMDGFGGVRYATLTTVTRQQRESGILHNATILRKMISAQGADTKIKLDLKGFDDIQRVSGGELIETLTDAYSRYGDDDCIVLCRSNKMAIRYNLGIRSMVEFKEDRLVRG
ncbi:MAG: AAA family ATPase, partial [Bacteroidales bacterium]|nr:AAA family ATPase [Bacteroidales bacterium]